MPNIMLAIVYTAIYLTMSLTQKDISVQTQHFRRKGVKNKLNYQI